jgi:ferrous iron transport protein B
MTAERYGFIAGIVREVQTSSTQQRVDVSRNIDLVLTHRLFGFPIFIFFIWAMFQLTFTLGEYPVQGSRPGWNGFPGLRAPSCPTGCCATCRERDHRRGRQRDRVSAQHPDPLFLHRLFEDTGYMARSAFLMDKIMHLIGLHGKSFIPMLMGFGCNVPAIMAARTLESEKDRILTILITPFMSCSAKLPVYVVLAGAFFGPRAGTVIFGLYLLGIVLSIITGRIFRSTLLKGVDAPFVMELPPYRMPMAKSLLIHMWDRSKIFLTKMGKIILIGSILIWALSNFPRPPGAAEPSARTDPAPVAAALASDAGGQADLEAAQRRAQKAAQTEYSFIGRIGRMIAPVFEPLGIDWRGGVALLSGFVAKEIVVSTMGVLYATGESDEEDALERALTASGMTPLSALSMMVFVLLYLPCFATTAAIRRETGSTRWMLFSIGYSTAVAWLMAFFVFQGGRLIGLS